MSFKSECLVDQPYVLWMLDEVSGTTAVDSSGNGRNGTYTNGPLLAQRPLIPTYGGTSAYFDATDDHVISSFLLNASIMTMEVWFDFDGVGTGVNRDLIAGFTDGYNGASYDKDFVIDPFAQLGFYCYTSPVEKFIWTTSAPGAGTHHLVGISDGTNIIFYVNGALIGSTAGAGSYTGYAVPNVIVGGRTSLWVNHLGRRAGFAVYTTALDESRVQAHYQAGLRDPLIMDYSKFPHSNMRPI